MYICKNKLKMVETKTCSKCGRALPLSEFNKHKSRKDGLEVYCKECSKKRFKQWYAEHRDERIEKTKQYNAEHAEAKKQYHKQYYAVNREHILEQQKQYNADNSEARKHYWKQYNAEKYSTIEGYARVIRKDNLRADRKQGRIAANEDPLPSIEQYIELLQKLDFYDGKQYHWSEMGLDRIDNSKPHTLDNVVPCTTEHNVQRQKMSFEEFCELMQKKMS
jgi:DNA-directed RNA polymerase subunit RPC12/RpoP